MPSHSSHIFIAAMLLCCAHPAAAQIVGRAVSADPDLYVGFDQPDPDYDISGDMFGIRSRDLPDAPECLTCPGLPFSIVDDTYDLFDPFPTDKLGLIRSEDFDPFFGVVDTVNDSGERLNTASWTFDIAGLSNLRISADMAAMGDFEAGNIENPSQDAYVFDYAVDGGAYQILFESSVDTDVSQEYEMELPHPDNPLIALEDPLAVNGLTLYNVFQTLSAAATVFGNRLEVRFRAIADGAEEAFAFRNLIVEALAGGGELAADFNANGTVEQGDLDLVLLNWGADGSPPPGWKNDLPFGLIDQEELDGVLLNWGKAGARGLPGTSVPEPSALETALLLILLGSARLLRANRVNLSEAGR
jgi:hypothetical protein